MTTIPLPDPDRPPEQLRRIYEVIRRREKLVFDTDHVSNIWLCQAHDPAYLEANWERARAIRQRGDLPPRTQELVAVAVSAVNTCHY